MQPAGWRRLRVGLVDRVRPSVISVERGGRLVQFGGQPVSPGFSAVEPSIFGIRRRLGFQLGLVLTFHRAGLPFALGVHAPARPCACARRSYREPAPRVAPQTPDPPLCDCWAHQRIRVLDPHCLKTRPGGERDRGVLQINCANTSRPAPSLPTTADVSGMADIPAESA